MVSRRQRTSGFTYLGVLIAIAIMGLLVTGASDVWTKVAERQRRVELEWVGQQYIKAIGSYYQSTPGVAKVYPATLTDLLDDRRHLTVKRHLRALYLNPFTARADWTPVITNDGRIQGVRITVAGDNESWTKEYAYRPQ